MGRPSKAAAWTTEDRLQLITHWKRGGLTDKEVAEKIGIKQSTLVDWRNRYPQIYEALKKGFEESVIEAENALFSRFVKQTITEEKIEMWELPTGEVKKHKIVTKKEVLPDTTAIIFYLKAKGGWRDNMDLTKGTNAITDQRRKEIEEAFNASE